MLKKNEKKVIFYGYLFIKNRINRRIVTRKNADELLNGIRRNDKKILESIYKECFPTIRYLVVVNNGNVHDAKDIYQEGILIIYQKSKNDDFKITCAFKTYLYSVCRLLWLKHLDEIKQNKLTLIEDEPFKDFYENIQLDYEKNEKYQLYRKCFLTLSKDCQRVLELYFGNVSLKTISRIMGYKSEKYTKKRKYQCKLSLIKKIKINSKFKELNNEELF